MVISAFSSINAVEAYEVESTTNKIYYEDAIIIDLDGNIVTEKFKTENKESFNKGDYYSIKQNLAKSELTLITAVPSNELTIENNEKDSASTLQLIPNLPVDGGGAGAYNAYEVETYNNKVMTRYRVYAYGTPDETGNKFISYSNHLKVKMITQGNAVGWGVDLSYPSNVKLVNSTPNVVRYEECPYIKYSDGTYYYIHFYAKIVLPLATSGTQPTVEVTEY